MQMAVSYSLDESFQPVSNLQHGWLNDHEEKGQTVKSFERDTDKAVPNEM